MPSTRSAASLAAAKASGAKVECYRENDLIEVSSTEIREAASQGKTLKGLVPENVAEYIVKNRLYRYDEAVSIELIKADLSERLTEEKYTHSSGVAKEAARLGKLLGADEEKCYLAGLLHDCAKCLTKAQLDWMNVKLEDYCFGDPYCGVNHRVLHGFTGRILAEKRYGVSDPEVLEAVACHVTGQPEMGIIAQIVFISDFTEENREGAFFDKIRAELSERGVRRFVASPENFRDNLQFLAESGFDVEFPVQQSTPLFISLTRPTAMPKDLCVYERGGLWITVKPVPRTFDTPEGASTRLDLSWEAN